MTKPKLLFVLNRIAIGGPATNTLAIAHALHKEFEVLLITGEPEPGEESAAYLLKEYNGFQVEIIRSFKRAVLPINDFVAFRKMKAIIKKFKPDIVHTHGSKPGVLARIAAWNLNVPVIVHTYHGHVFHSYFNSFISKTIVLAERWLAKRSTYLIAINERIKDDLENVYCIASSKKIIVNRLGIDVEKFKDVNEEKRSAFRSEFALSTDVVSIGIIGRLVPVKQHTLFVELAEHVMKMLSASVKLKFFIIGDGDQKKKIENIFVQKKISFTDTMPYYNAEASVVFTSWRKDIDIVLSGLDIIVLTSLNEGTPVSIMEAMAASRPVVARSVGGIQELLTNGKTGYAYEKAAELKNALLKLIENPDLRKKIGTEARMFAQQNLSIDNQVNQLKKIYLQAKCHNK